MLEIKKDEFYDASTPPIPVEKYYLDNNILNTRQMTYEFYVYDGELMENGMEPTFEIDDIVADEKGNNYCIYKYERILREIGAELLDENMKRTGSKVYLEECDIVHKLNNAVFI